ncbi:peptidoglycan DD-metalloendopeptidase family protein [Pseudodesulfovibrio sp. F-1]|uniref:Peptidoglycan DD-metalloendopeptidase family protein n=2 Tax=Pseudodesulfovibrio alkaliphilus TaxID=2661613 RepID=A0A7K1KRZ6_9BACT|nr:peptidoglycan DD-metalloendopeptidase family protein [Pseudodesulfovibrio alkaliphilus]
MKRFAFWVFLITMLCLSMVPLSVPAQGFGLEEGDGVPMDSSAVAQSVQAESPTPGSALVLAAPGQAGVGQPFLVRLTSDQPLDSVSVHWQGKEVVPTISVWNDRHVALAMLGTDVLNAKTGKEELVVIASIDGKESTLRRSLQLVPVEYPRQELTLPEKMVTPPAEVLERIRAEREVTRAALETVSPVRMWRLPLERPVGGEESSPYGAQRILNGKPKNPHRGLDFRSPMNNPIKCVADGVVILVGDFYYAGKSIYVDHGNGVISLYFHLEKPMVKEGDTVQRGQVIGLTGMTGRSTGPHLHLSISVLGRLVDPAPLLKYTVDDMLN